MGRLQFLRTRRVPLRWRPHVRCRARPRRLPPVMVRLNYVAGQRLGSVAPDHIVIAARRGSFADPSRDTLDIVCGARRALTFGTKSMRVGDRDLIIVRMNFAESEEAVRVAAVIDKSGLQ